ncbi:hypothetical protein DUI87_14954 [Hirundo rustica rustica]|uniref:Nucleoporin NDC1 n=1 Tax=Hirundo rustica rustica TaxID=333673 RepID=A0A3M0K6E5_HIRRU|nr:hypothetical protein DUI87_14954 [Hirundo rustica rustica]
MEAAAGGQRALLRQVLGWRVAATITWSVLLLPICTAAFVVFSGLDPFHPVRWISNSFNDLYTSYVIFCIFLMSVVIIVISIFNVEFYAVVPSIPCSRLALIGKIIHPQQVIHSFVHAIMGMLVAWCATVMTKGRFQFLAVSCTPSERLYPKGVDMYHDGSPYRQSHHFPVQPTFAQETDQCLPKILNSNPPLLIKFLALQDLMLLSQYSPVRRQEVFSLSQPGGHPHNWTAISRECLSLLSDLTQRLIAQQEAAAANGRAKPPVGEMKVPPQTPGAVGIEDMSFQSQRSNIVLRASMSPLVKPSLMPVKTSPGSDVGSPFSSPALSYKMGIVDVKSPWHGSVQSPLVVRRGPKLWTSISDKKLLVQTSADNVFLQQGKGGPVFETQHPEASIQAVFSDAQMHIWALEGLSHLVAASFTEDQFGVVQTTLPAILNTLLTLQEVVDRHFKLPHVSSKPPRISGSLVDTSYKTLRFALRASLKTALYRITTVFGEHLNAVQVSTEHKKRLQQFLEYKE